MKKVLILFLILLTACSTAINPTIPNQQAQVDSLKLFSENEDVFYSFNEQEKPIKTGVLEEIKNIANNTKFNITVWNSDSYATRNECTSGKVCYLRVEHKGTQKLNIINETSFKIIQEGDIRNGFWCITYSKMIYEGVNAIEISNIDKVHYDHCYKAMNQTFDLKISGNGNYSIYLNNTQ